MDSSSFDLRGKVALVTGAGRGIGLEIARALAANGCAVAIQDTELDVADSEAKAIKRQGGRAVALPGDIADLSLAKSLVEQTIDRLGGFHILVNNAAIQSTEPWLEQSAETMEAQFRANVVFPLLLCQHAVPVMKQQRWGRILNVGSIQQRKGNPSMLAYAMSKAALNTATRSLARDLAADNIAVNLIAPGYFDTWRNRHDFASEEDKAAKGKAYVPVGRVGQPQDCGGVALLLCSDAGAYITGQTIYVDGGLSVR